MGRGAKKLFLLALPALLLPAIAARPAGVPDGERWTVVLSGDADGYLAPCGCTSPMTGGLRRRATALKGVSDPRRVVLDNGGLSGGVDRQHVLKAETAAQALELARVDAANFSAADARLGAGEALALARLSGDRFVSTSLQAGDALPIVPWREVGPFLVGGATARPGSLGPGLGAVAIVPNEAAHRLASEAASRGLAPVMLFDGDRAAARLLARAEPALRLVTYRSTGRPSNALEREGACALASPGERGKAVLRLGWEGMAFVSQTVDALGPEVEDDPEADALYRTYLKRVSSEKLLEKAPHTLPSGFVGGERCASCHAEAAKSWRASGHAHALATLERVGHQRDPDCVPCHVVGLSKGGAEPTMAYVSRAATPRLADVGCESCHGAGAAHAASPWKSPLPKVGEKACLPCHTPENSPEFDFATYWPKIRHGADGPKGRPKVRRP